MKLRTRIASTEAIETKAASCVCSLDVTLAQGRRRSFRNVGRRAADPTMTLASGARNSEQSDIEWLLLAVGKPGLCRRSTLRQSPDKQSYGGRTTDCSLLEEARPRAGFHGVLLLSGQEPRQLSPARKQHEHLPVGRELSSPAPRGRQ